MLALALLACSGAGTEGTTPTDPCADPPTWDDFAQGYVATWCASCHSSALGGEDRQGAPVGFDFDTWAQVYAMRALVADTATGPDATMPPLGGVPEGDVALFAEWLACGAPGQDEPPGPCDTLTVGPAATVTDAASAEAVCAAGNAVAALTVSGAVEIGCLCAIEGDVVVGGEVDLPLLESVGGSLAADGTLAALRAPELASVGGDVVLVGEPVVALDLTGLVTIGGDLSLTELPALGAVSLDALYAVGGELVVARDPLLASLDLPRLRTVAGRLAIEELPELVELLGTRSIEEVGGDLVLSELDALPVLDDVAFLRLDSVGGDLLVTGNDALTAIHGFTLVTDVGGDLAIEGSEALVRIEGFDNLAHTGGDLRIRQNPRQESVNGLITVGSVGGTLVLEDLPALLTLPGLEESLVTVGGLRLARIGVSALPAFALLGEVTGELRIEDADRLARLEGFPALATAGSLVIAANAELEALGGFGALTAIPGDVTVTDNPELPQSAVDGWLAGVAVGGTITASGNGS